MLEDLKIFAGIPALFDGQPPPAMWGVEYWLITSWNINERLKKVFLGHAPPAAQDYAP